MNEVEAVARALATAEGRNPDEDSGRGPMVTTTERTSVFSASYSFGPQPLLYWKLYEKEAEAFIACSDALRAAREASRTD